MAANGQSLRPSQYITTFGPSSVLETPDGPVVIAAPSHSTLFENIHPEAYEIQDLRLSQTLLNNKKIFRIPSNAELGVKENRLVYHAYYFPRWSLCPTHGILYRYKPQSLIGCPRCKTASKWGKVWAKSREEAVRFVLACSHGHLDEVSWSLLIKHKKGCSKPEYLRWQGGGGALRNIRIECPECRENANFGEVYSRNFSCSGRFPEENNRRVDCNRPAKIIQRGAANLRVSEIKTALTIPPLDTQLHRLLQSRAVLDVLVAIPVNSKNLLVQLLDNLVKGNRLDPLISATIKQYEEVEILGVIYDILSEITNPKKSTEATLRQDEFLSLHNAACDGAPPQRSDKPGGPNQFEVYKENVTTFRLGSGRILRVTPLSRLRVVMVQIGYTRPIDTNQNDSQENSPIIIPVEYMPPNESTAWHPGVELFGEGIFLDFVSDTEPKGISEHFPLQGEAYSRWLAAHNSPSSYQKIKAMLANKDEDLHRLDYLNPVFVWWHTLSHRLITALSVDSGYSSAAIRERVYTCTINNKTVGGLLLYTAQSGGDGTLGGLIGLVPHFDRILQSALRNIDACSNDPICIEEEFGEDKVNGSACYACQLISETSCEHRNTLLDRRLLLENMP
ncbi:DUF1998 domain-containing protein [Nostoc sp.]|uniref:DUF1998 domain-containing protein n=1 Tax=Nostoc sp. TaxID=1180 RepID=UPI002FFD034F